MKLLLSSKLITIIVAALAISLIAAVSVAWGLTVYPGGVTHVGDEEIATVVAKSGTMVGDQAVASLTAMLGASGPTVEATVDAATYWVIDPTTGKLVPAIDEGLDKLGYSIYLEPYPTVRPTLEPNDLGVDIVLPNKAGVHILNAKDAAMIIAGGAEGAGAEIGGGAEVAVGVIVTSWGNYVLVAEGEAENVANVAQQASAAIKTGIWKNVQVETCVAAEQSGKTVIVAVPNGTIGGWQSGDPYQKCPATPLTVE